MEWLRSILESTNLPWVTAFVLGLLTALSPCPLATNIVAVGVISKEIDNPKRVLWRGILYTLGRVLAYTVLGVALILLINNGLSVFGIQKGFGKYGEMLLPFILVIVGVLVLTAHRIKLPSFGFNGDGNRLKKRGGWGAFLLGVLFALAFCPTSGIFFFGMLIPLSVSASAGYLLPVLFAVATSLPVLIVAWILAFSVNGIGRFYGKMKTFQRWFNVVVGVVFILSGVYYGLMYFGLI